MVFLPAPSIALSWPFDQDASVRAIGHADQEQSRPDYL
jgi:hypothetical protein